MQRLIAAFLSAQLVGGCSFAFVKGPPSNHRDQETVDCSTSNAAPILDTLWTGLETVNLISAASATDEEWAAKFGGEPPMNRSTAVPFYVGLAVLSGASMIYGYAKTSECRRAKAEAQERVASGRRAPNPDEEPAVGPVGPRAVRASGTAGVAGAAAPTALAPAAPPRSPTPVAGVTGPSAPATGAPAAPTTGAPAPSAPDSGASSPAAAPSPAGN